MNAALCKTGIAGTALILSVTSLCAQQITPVEPAGRIQLPSLRHSDTPESSSRATTRNPEKVRLLLSAYHGFSRAALEAASAEVPAILRAFIDDPDESMLVHRQAIKALALYLSDTNFEFIEQKLLQGPHGLQVLYLNSLRKYSETREREITNLLAPMLSSDSVAVRHAAVSLSGNLSPSVILREHLSLRLNEEQDPSVRKAIQRALPR